MGVLHSDSGLVLRNTYRPVEKPTEMDLIELLEYELAWKDFYLIATEVYNKLSEIKEYHPGFEICSGVFGEGILRKMDRYGLLLNELRNKYDSCES